MHDAIEPPPVAPDTRIYVLAPWIISIISTLATIATLVIRSGESAHFFTAYGVLVLAIGVPAGVVSARVAYVAAVHGGATNGKRVATRYFLAAFLLVAAAMAVMLPPLD
ncbi:MAG: hypothetical protein RIB58_07490 [Phycisphaerales bacterium]|jgi:hypothetical protein